MRKALVLYDSIYGNTKKVAMSLSRGLEAGGIYVDCISIQDFNTNKLNNYDVIGIGGPTHFHGASKRMKSFLSKIDHFKMKGKQGFAFATKGDFKMAGTATKRIIRYLKKMRLTIIHPAITAIVIDQEGPLQEHTLERMEKMGLTISEKINNLNSKKNHFNSNNSSQTHKFLKWNSIKWVLLGGGSLFFFIRAIYLASSGGDCFGTINPFCSWFLLLFEVAMSGVTGITAIIGIILWIRLDIQRFNIKKLNLHKIILGGGITAYIIHFVRVTIWIILCVI